MMRRRDRDGRDVWENGSAEMSRRVVTDNNLLSRAAENAENAPPELRRWERASVSLSCVCVCVCVAIHTSCAVTYLAPKASTRRFGTRRERRAKELGYFASDTFTIIVMLSPLSKIRPMVFLVPFFLFTSSASSSTRFMYSSKPCAARKRPEERSAAVSGGGDDD